MSKEIVAYHFTGSTLRDGRPIPKIGEWLIHSGPIIPCKSGLHASEHPFDALAYAPGCMLHKVLLSGDIQTHGNPVDKIVANKRMIVTSFDATEILFLFTRKQAETVLDKWNAPDVVVEYIKTGNQALRAAARAAAWSAAESAAESAARAAAWSAAESAAESAAWYAARSAAWSAAESAAWAAARDAARAAARDAARAAAREMFNNIITEEFKKLNDQ